MVLNPLFRFFYWNIYFLSGSENRTITDPHYWSVRGPHEHHSSIKQHGRESCSHNIYTHPQRTTNNKHTTSNTQHTTHTFTISPARHTQYIHKINTYTHREQPSTDTIHPNINGPTECTQPTSHPNRNISTQSNRVPIFLHPPPTPSS